ncbi:hypothetical protein CLV78_102679 [Aliiruegeria haliotis]|uniref:DUF1178 family protein n=1 Tax=Aliiruegeria haliotis TaxID=1280846 RepID=A0A2T0RWD6_9RHOB|nr:DUF1178 family protein [Aliiruegeria haliotis]PRY25499.1 hypothetical protein CLV78_102679 [Aliiruegeria haliotis]
MIRYSLLCESKHRFDSWFASADAYEKLHGAGMVSCAVCGSTQVEKAMMAPNVSSGESTAQPEVSDRPLSKPASPAEQTVADLRKKIEENSDYVGTEFAREARAIHDGEAPKRSIHGEANAKDAKSLIDDGIPVLPLPFAPGRKTN